MCHYKILLTADFTEQNIEFYNIRLIHITVRILR